MSRRTLLAAAGLAAALIVAAVYGTIWILRQPISTSPTAEVEEYVAPEAAAGEAATEPASEGHIRVTLYVLDPSGEILVVEPQEIPLESSVQLQAKQVVELLVRRSAAIPEGVELRELFITSQGVAYVDLSNELVENHPGGTSAEELTVFSLSSTLIANFPAVKLVKILVEGREVQTLAGHLDLTLPYGRAPDYLRPAPRGAEARNEAG